MTTPGGLGDRQLLADIFGSRPAPPTPREADACLRRAQAALRSTGHGELAEQLAGATAAVTVVDGNQQTVDVSVAVSAAGLGVVRAGEVELNRELAAALHHDGWALRSLQVVAADPGRPAPTAPPKRGELIEMIAQAVAGWKSYEVTAVCDRLGMPGHPDPKADPFSSKAVYTRARLQVLEVPELVRIARGVLEDRDDDALEDLVARWRPEGPAGPVKNLVFGSTRKPDLVLLDALSNELGLVNRDAALLYDDPVPDDGLSWRALLRALLPDRAAASEEDAATELYRRLQKCLASEPERLVFRAYGRRYRRLGFDQPALLPQVWVHYDPRSRHQRGGTPVLTTQRMDFLLLPAGGRRIVVEVDGATHYTDEDGKPSPGRYGQMMRDDRELRLRGYEVFRFGGAELTDAAAGAELLDRFFTRLLET